MKTVTSSSKTASAGKVRERHPDARPLSGEELGALAKRMVNAKTKQTRNALQEKIVRGFYGSPNRMNLKISKQESSVRKAKALITDFQPMEECLASGASCPAERMVVELGLSPRNIRMREDMAGLKFPWFVDVYSAMKRHGLCPMNKSWEEWLDR